MKKDRKKKGFTLIELIVVIAILGILAAVLIPRFTGFQDKAKSTKALVDAKNIATAIDGWYIEKSDYPKNADKTEILKTALNDSTSSTGTLTLYSNGGFLWTTTTGSYKAGRTDATKGVEMNPTAGGAVTP